MIKRLLGFCYSLLVMFATVSIIVLAPHPASAATINPHPRPPGTDNYVKLMTSAAGAIVADAVKFSPVFTESVLVNSNFNGDITGGAPSGWTVGADANTSATVAATTSSIDKVLKLDDNNTSGGFAQVTKSFAAQTGILTASWKFMEPSAGNWPKFFLRNGTTTAIELYADATGLYYKTTSGTNVYVPGINTANNQWYNVKIVANIATDTCDIYVDGLLKVNNAPFKAAVSQIDTIQFGTGNSTNFDLYLDDIWVTSI